MTAAAQEQLGGDSPFLYEVEITPAGIMTRQSGIETKRPWSVVEEIVDTSDRLEFHCRIGGILMRGSVCIDTPAAAIWDRLPRIRQQTLLVSEAEVDLEGGWLGRLLEPPMAFATRRTAPNSLAAFKYQVEHGRPYEGRHSTLLRTTISG